MQYSVFRLAKLDYVQLIFLHVFPLKSKDFVNCACPTGVFLAEFLSLAKYKPKGKKPYEETSRMRMLKINIKCLEAYFKSCFTFKSLNNFPIFFIVLVISLSVVLTPFSFIFLTIKVYLHTVRPHAHAFYGIGLS